MGGFSGVFFSCSSEDCRYTLFSILFQITRDFSFLDYILGGCQLMFTVRTLAAVCPVVVINMSRSKLLKGGAAGGCPWAS